MWMFQNDAPIIEAQHLWYDMILSSTYGNHKRPDDPRRSALKR